MHVGSVHVREGWGIQGTGVGLRLSKEPRVHPTVARACACLEVKEVAMAVVVGGRGGIWEAGRQKQSGASALK